ncbi:MAG: hypothetical protein Tsb002_34420 [Wenzhouxiangellaceae bacterium]
MSRRCIIEINDSGLRLITADGISKPSPGYACAADRELLLGAAAADQLRINPRQTHDRFWQQLNQQALPRPCAAARSHADLAYFHLAQLWREHGPAVDEVTLLVPGANSLQANELLLGITRALAMPVSRLIPNPLIYARCAAANATVVLDAQLHQLTLDRLLPRHGQWQWQHSQVIAEQGLRTLYNRWAQWIGDAFLRQTRFDPLHNAASEQTLWQQLPAWLAALVDQPQLRVSMRSGRQTYQIELHRDELASAAANAYEALAEAIDRQSQAVLLSERISHLPGLIQHLRDGGLEPRLVDDERFAAQALACADELAEDAGSDTLYYQHLPMAPGHQKMADATRTTPSPLPPARPPTHLLDQHRALPLTALPLNLPDRNGDVQLLRDQQGRLRLRHSGRQSVLINRQPAGPAAVLQLGDQIEIDRRLYALIEVVAESNRGDDGPAPH